MRCYTKAERREHGGGSLPTICETSEKKEGGGVRYEFYNPNPMEFDLHLVTCGSEDCRDHFVCSPHIRKYHLLHFIIRGEGFYEESGNTHRVCKGELFVIYPDTVVTYWSPDPEKTWSFCWIGFTGGKAARYLEKCGVSKENPVLALQSLDFLTNSMELIRYTQSQNTVSELKLNRYVLSCLESIKEESDNPDGAAVENHVTKAVRYIETNYMNGIAAKDVISFVKLDRSYFYRIFKRQTGCSPERFLIEYRIERAKELISSGRYTFTEIANYVGICDIYYFSKLFKSVAGATPSEYKKAPLKTHPLDPKRT